MTKIAISGDGGFGCELLDLLEVHNVVGADYGILGSKCDFADKKFSGDG